MAKCKFPLAMRIEALASCDDSWRQHCPEYMQQLLKLALVIHVGPDFD